MRTFYKMTGSGNDFVFFDARDGTLGGLEAPERIRSICARGTGVGADGVVFLERTPQADVGIRYVNSDGSPASLCGNAALCTVRLVTQLGIAAPGTIRIATDAGVVTGRLVGDTPEFDLGTVEPLVVAAPIDLASGEQRIGYGVAGVPHLIVLVDDVAMVDVVARGRALRSHSFAGPPGANVNFISNTPSPGGGAGEWSLRTYERGVEAETLACGTGAVAAAAVLSAWGLARAMPIRLRTRSGAPLDVTLRPTGGGWLAALRGEGRLVYRGELAEH